MNKKSKGYILAIVLTIMAVSLVVYEIKSNRANLDIFNKKDEVITWEEEKTEENNTNKKIKLSQEEERMLESSPIGEKIKNSLNYPDKEEIHFKMINAVDNFKTCKGEFIEEMPRENSRMKCTFAVDTENKTSVNVDDTEGKEPITLIYHDNKRKVFDDNDKIYREFEEKQHKAKPTIVKPIRLFLKPELNRTDLGYLGVSRYIISSDSLTKYLFIYEDWDYTESTFLGRDVYKLEGAIDQQLSNTNQGKFCLIMDKETGIILQFLSFDDNENVKYKLECTNLEVNIPIDESVYNKDTSGYVKK
ncbi:hypothetical protein [Clostridium sp. UBA1056]|uniref:hypothetical protein n=1 Tax=unclassified Clostridium TaxID=2614128 RepID=UPI0032162E2C